jgi:hypothetical protein
MDQQHDYALLAAVRNDVQTHEIAGSAAALDRLELLLNRFADTLEDVAEEYRFRTERP